MSRLIDADRLIENLKGSLFYSDAIPFVEDAPTAYDVEKVVEEIKKLENPYDADQWFTSRKLRRAIDIVRKGGVEE